MKRKRNLKYLKTAIGLLSMKTSFGFAMELQTLVKWVKQLAFCSQTWIRDACVAQ